MTTNGIYFQFILPYCLMFGVSAQSVLLSPALAEVEENSSITLTCFYDGKELINSSRWTHSSSSVNPVIGLLDGDCVASGILNNSSLYSWRCLGNNTFSLTLKNVQRSQHNEIWKCRQYFVDSNDVNIFVQVPVTNVEMINKTDSITLPENTTANFTCRTTTYSRPSATISWMLDNQTIITQDDITIGTGRSDFSRDKENLTLITSVLSYSFKREWNGMKMYCSASNILNNSVVSDSTRLNIIYPPKVSPTVLEIRTGKKYKAIKDTQGRLTCSAPGGNPLANLSWIINDNSTVSFNANSGNVANEILTWNVSSEQDTNYTCLSEHELGETQNVTVEVEVLYPPEAPTIRRGSSLVSGIVKRIINKTVSLFCGSDSNPPSTYIWTLPNSSKFTGESLIFRKVDLSDTGLYKCQAMNTMVPTIGQEVVGVNITTVNIEVLFPPETPYFTYGSLDGPIIQNDTIDVIRGDSVTLACHSSGNPVPNYVWSNTTILNYKQVFKVTSIFNDTTVLCNVTNEMVETVGESRIGESSARLKFNVLYPPTISFFLFENSQNDQVFVSKYLSIVENSSFSLTCISDSRPKPFSILWRKSGQTTSNVLTINDVKREQSGWYTCQSLNTMKRTFGSSEQGNTSKSLHLDILYPPDIDTINNTIAVEGSTVNISCPVIDGNPKQSTVRWTRDIDSQQWESKYLEFTNISRYDAATYTCTVSNNMTTTGDNTTVGMKSREINIKVLYKSGVQAFSINERDGERNVIVDENDTAEFRCSVESNPSSTVTLTFQNKTLIRQSVTKTVTYKIVKTSCIQAGRYRCSGYNDYNNGYPDEAYVQLHVRCFPRPSQYANIQNKFYIAEHTSVTLSFSTLAYPAPGFKWQRKKGSIWISVQNGYNTEIKSVGLQSNLTIFNVSQSDFGQYRLVIENSVGIYEHAYSIAKEEVPDKPRDFKIVNVTKSEVKMQWEPGLSRGPLQTFVLSYKRSTANEWKHVSIPDKGELLIQYTVNGLKSGTKYMLKLSAYNRLGSSDETDALTIDTLEIEVALYKPLEEAINPHYIIVGCVAFFVALVLVIVAVVLRKRRKPLRHLKKQNRENKNAAKKQRGKNRQLRNSTEVKSVRLYEEIDGENDQQAKVAGPIPAYEEMEIRSGACQIQQKQDQTYEDMKTGRLAPIKVLVDEKTTKQQKRENFEEAGDLSGEYTLLKVGSQVANNEENGNITRESSRYSTLKLTEYTNLKLFDGGNNPEQKKKETQPKDAGEISGEYTLLKVGSEAAGNKENGNKTDENSRYSTLKMTEYTNLKY